MELPLRSKLSSVSTAMYLLNRDFSLELRIDGIKNESTLLIFSDLTLILSNFFRPRKLSKAVTQS